MEVHNSSTTKPTSFGELGCSISLDTWRSTMGIDVSMRESSQAGVMGGRHFDLRVGVRKWRPCTAEREEMKDVMQWRLEELPYGGIMKKLMVRSLWWFIRSLANIMVGTSWGALGEDTNTSMLFLSMTGCCNIWSDAEYKRICKYPPLAWMCVCIFTYDTSISLELGNGSWKSVTASRNWLLQKQFFGDQFICVTAATNGYSKNKLRVCNGRKRKIYSLWSLM